MAFYCRIYNTDRGQDIKSYKLPSLIFWTKKYMLETLDECFDFIVRMSKDSVMNIFEKELLKQQCVGACYKNSNLVIVVMTNSKFNNKTIQKLIHGLKNKYSLNFGQDDLDNFIAENQDFKPDKLDLIQCQLDDIKDIMIQNIDEVMKRGESIESLTDKSEKLKDEAAKFNIEVTKLNRRCWNCVLL